MSHVQVRVAIWLNPSPDTQNLGYQIVQSLFSLADGGLAASASARAWPTSSPSWPPT